MKTAYVIVGVTVVVGVVAAIVLLCALFIPRKFCVLLKTDAMKTI